VTRAILTSTAASGHQNVRVPTPTSGASIGVGCSGSDPIWNKGGIQWLVQQKLGVSPLFDKCTTPGAPITVHMTNPPSFGVYAWQNMATYEYLHIGDNPNLDGIHDPSKLHQWAQKFWAEGHAGAGGETLLWTLQPVYNANATTFLAWIANAENEYNIAQDYCNVRVPAGKRLVRQIPGLQLFRRFFQDQQAGLAPTATWLADLYTDTFHMVQGKISYIASVIGAACMYGIDPRTMPNDMQTASGFTVPEAQYVKACISDTIKAFQRAGVNTAAWT